jgi:leucyl/phenylalanyl-tRNA--protein transferase
VAAGGDLEPDTILAAYRQGIFPWPHPGLPLVWFCPEERGILDFALLHVPRRLERERRHSPFHFTLDKAFRAVIDACSMVPRPGQDSTWITPAMKAAYTRLHKLGIAHSVEAWSGDQLVGGLYGVEVDGAFAGESMFHYASNASKMALLHLVDHLRGRGLDWMDIQVMTPHMDALGAVEIPRDAFLERLAHTRARGLKLFGARPLSRP